MKAIVVYGSTGGNAQMVSEYVRIGLEEAGRSVTTANVAGFDMAKLNDFELIVLGSSTWNIGKEQGQLQHDWRPAYEKLTQLDLGQRAVAVFGVGHYHYTFTANAANILAEGVKKANGRLLEPIFKVDDVVDLFFDRAREWARGLTV